MANAILDGTDAVMLSEETAIGRYPVEAVEMMAKIATSVEREWEALRALSDLPAYFREGAGAGKTTVEDIVSLNAVEAAQALKIPYIVVPTQSGGTPHLISRFKPDCWIISLGGNEKANRLLAMSYGVFPVFMENKGGPQMDMILQFMGNSGMVRKGDRLIMIEEGVSTNETNGSESLRIITVR